MCFSARSSLNKMNTTSTTHRFNVTTAKPLTTPNTLDYELINPQDGKLKLECVRRCDV